MDEGRERRRQCRHYAGAHCSPSHSVLFLLFPREYLNDLVPYPAQVRHGPSFCTISMHARWMEVPKGGKYDQFTLSTNERGN